MTANPTALQLYTVRDQLNADRAGVLTQVAAIRLRRGRTVRHPQSTRRGSGPTWMRPACPRAACTRRPRVEDAEAVVRAARTLGADTVIIPYLPPARFADADSVQALARELNEAAARLAGQGLRLGYHNHDFELSSLVGGMPALEVLADQLDDAVLLEVDTYWAAVGGQDVVRPARPAGQPRRLPAHQGRPGGRQGRLHDRGRLRADAGGRDPGREPVRAWHVVELDRCATDMMTAVGDSLAWLTAQGLA